MAKITRRTFALIGACIAAAACFATPLSAAEAPKSMSIGPPVPSPAAFLELCSREPQFCVSGEAADAEKLAAIRSHALSQYWSTILPSVGAPPASGRPGGDAQRGFARQDRVAAPSEAFGHAFDWERVERLNREINTRIKHASDERAYGLSDYWVVPNGAFPRGDCEDYVLAKRQALVEAGTPADRLAIALVETRWGEAHAVLLLSTPKGEYVLDNLTPRILHWTEVDYVWRERQLPGQPLAWAEVEGPRP